MGLDMYIYRKKYLGKGTLEGKITDRKGEVVETKEEGDYFFAEKEVAYFRKSNQIHNYIVSHFGDPDADYKNVDLGIEDIKELRDVCKEVAEKAKLNLGLLKCGTLGGDIRGDVWLLNPTKNAYDKITGFTRSYVMPVERIKDGEYFERGADGQTDPLHNEPVYYKKISDGQYETYIFGEEITNSEEIAELLPTIDGFFFGSTDYDQYYLDDVKRAIEIFDEIITNHEADLARGVDPYDITYVYSVSY